MNGADAAEFEACPDSTPTLAPGLVATGENERLGAVLLDASLAPALKDRRNEWTIELADAAGEVLADAEVTQLRAFMPVHGHYGKPSATFEPSAEPGQVRAEIFFMMRGPWQVQIDADSPGAGEDRIVFEICVEE